MNQDQITGVLRILVPAICTWLAAKGFTAFGDAGIVAQVTAVVIGIAAIVWSYMSHRDAAKLAAAAAVDKKIQITVPQEVINANPGIAKVVANDDIPNVNKAA